MVQHRQILRLSEYLFDHVSLEEFVDVIEFLDSHFLSSFLMDGQTDCPITAFPDLLYFLIKTQNLAVLEIFSYFALQDITLPLEKKYSSPALIKK